MQDKILYENKMEQIEALKELIDKGDVETAIKELERILPDLPEECPKDILYYMLGNAYRKKGDWKKALDNYQYAIDINPQTVAVNARQMILSILNFYNKDMYNQ